MIPCQGWGRRIFKQLPRAEGKTIPNAKQTDQTNVRTNKRLDHSNLLFIECLGYEYQIQGWCSIKRWYEARDTLNMRRRQHVTHFLFYSVGVFYSFLHLCLWFDFDFVFVFSLREVNHHTNVTRNRICVFPIFFAIDEGCFGCWNESIYSHIWVLLTDV